jgi:hypothetical protein
MHVTDYGFRSACYRGHLLVAQRLYSQNDLDIHDRNDFTFRWLAIYHCPHCPNGLYGLGGIDIHASNDMVFRRACIVWRSQWLYRI